MNASPRPDRKRKGAPGSGSSLASPLPKLSARGAAAAAEAEAAAEVNASVVTEGEVEGASADARFFELASSREAKQPLLSVPPSWPRLSVDLPSRASPNGDAGIEDGARSAEIH